MFDGAAAGGQLDEGARTIRVKKRKVDRLVLRVSTKLRNKQGASAQARKPCPLVLQEKRRERLVENTAGAR